MTRRLSMVALLAASTFVLFPGMLDASSTDGVVAKPNVIVFLSDDVGWAEYGFQGNSDIPTPNIDSIAKNGVRFTNAYVAATVCSPSRAGLMTGRYPTRFGHEFNGGGGEGVASKSNKGEAGFGLPLAEITFAQRMKDLDYATCCIGKWHLGGTKETLPMARGFDEFYGTVANTSYYKPPQFIDSRKSSEANPVKDPNFYTTDAYRDYAVDYIGRQPPGKPYFLYFPFNAIHGPLQPAAPTKYIERFPNITDPKRKEFAGAMSALDDAVGAVLQKVRDRGQEENTLVIFFSDNGGPTWQTTSSNLPLHGSKGTTSEGGTRIPFCMQWKGKIEAGKVYEHPIQNLDMLPTAFTAGGGKVDPVWKLDGVDLMPFVTDANTAKPHEVLYWRFGDQWAIRKDDWKLVMSQADRADNKMPRLINLADDISESNDLSEKNPEKVQELAAAYSAWSKEQHEPLWKPFAKGTQSKKLKNKK